MTTRQFFHAFLASAMLAATAGLMTACTSNDDNPAMPNGPSESVIKEKIIGKWKVVTQDGEERVTNRQAIMTFFADGTMTYSRSYYSDYWGLQIWDNKAPFTYTISGNTIKRNGLEDNGKIRDTFYDVSAISDKEMQMVLTGYIMEGQSYSRHQVNQYQRVTADYSSDIIGTWEGVEMTGDETYGNTEARITYTAYGNYLYNKKNSEGKWEMVTSHDESEYFVDGDLLTMRWQEVGAEMNYECWDIDEIKDGQMKWSALRERKDGTRFTTTFTWHKVTENPPVITLDLGTFKLGVFLVEGGDYSMKYVRGDAEKTVTGTLSDFYGSHVLVTNGLWASVMGSKPAGQTNNGDKCPVTMVSYEEVAGKGGFLEKVNAMLKSQLPEGMVIRLPTEAEWQYMAQGGRMSKGYKYAGSDNLDDVAWHKGNSESQIHPIAQKQANELGFWDMTGHVWEMTSDWFAELSDITAEQGKDYAGPATGNEKVARGGSFRNDGNLCVIGYHGKCRPGNIADDGLGFRLVLGKPIQ